MMGMAMKYHVDRVPGEWFLQPARAQVRVNFQRFSFDRGRDRSVVQQSHLLLGTQPAQRSLQLERLIHRFPHELFDQRLSPGSQRTSAEAAGKAFDAGKADPEYLVRIAVEYAYPRVRQNPRHLAHLAALVVMVAEHRDNGNCDRCKRPGHVTSFLGIPPVRQVPTEGQDIRVLGHLTKQDLERWLEPSTA
jgi:hypothetical protein